MKIPVLNGNPKKGDTFRLTDALLKGMNRDGWHEVHIDNAIKKRSRLARDALAVGSAGTVIA